MPRSLGVYLKNEDLKRLDAICDELGVNTHALMQWAMLEFLKRYEAGEVKPRMETQMVLIPPEVENNQP